MSEKTEEPTPKRLEKAREDGDSGTSAFAAQSLGFLVAIVTVPAAVRASAAWGADALRVAIRSASEASVEARVDPVGLAGTVIALSFPALLAVGLTGATVSLLQSGGMISTKKLVPDLKRLNPFEGAKSLFSSARIFSVARALFGAGVVSYLAYVALRAHAVDIAHLVGRPEYLPFVAGEISARLARDAALVGLGLGVLDLVVVRRGWMKRLRMGKDEVKREHKESDGDPQVKTARERARHEMLAVATVGNVRDAAVVVVSPTHFACALRYEESKGDAAPVAIASGEGELAQQIIRAARDYGISVVLDVPLARALAHLEVGDAIPE
ncbi:MAG: EscU/YscU/HrcU family type III secretion system export apparatus switch protein, partial [Polyangiaceae bacterium]